MVLSTFIQPYLADQMTSMLMNDVLLVNAILSLYTVLQAIRNISRHLQVRTTVARIPRNM